MGPAAFMWLRAQRIPRYTIAGIVQHDDPVTESITALHPWHVAGDVNAATALGLRVPQCESFYHPGSSDTGTLYLVDQWSRSRATLHVITDPPYEVRQSGERKLWGDVETAYRWWIDAGEPAVDTWEFSVTPHGQRVERPGSPG